MVPTFGLLQGLLCRPFSVNTECVHIAHYITVRETKDFLGELGWALWDVLAPPPEMMEGWEEGGNDGDYDENPDRGTQVVNPLCGALVKSS